MGNNNYSFVDCRPNPRSMVPITPYELWQLEHYGNFVLEFNQNDIEPGKTWFENQIEIFENEINNG